MPAKRLAAVGMSACDIMRLQAEARVATRACESSGLPGNPG
ncbi:hypothetical protein OAO87_01240 [bacterium]|nr:hypothetical protein [bacterium]